MVSKTNWFNVNKNKLGNLTIGLSIQDNNQDIMGMRDDGGVDKTQRKIIIDKALVQSIRQVIIKLIQIQNTAQ